MELSFPSVSPAGREVTDAPSLPLTEHRDEFPGCGARLGCLISMQMRLCVIPCECNSMWITDAAVNKRAE